MKKDTSNSTPMPLWLSIVMSIVTILLSSLLSWRISVNSSRYAAINDSQKEILLKEASVLNKICDIERETELVIVPVIENYIIRETTITNIWSENHQLLGRDTVFRDIPKRDTSFYHIPRFVCYKSSNERVISCLEYIEQHLNDLGYRTYDQVKDIVRFTKIHPILLIEFDKSIKSDWTDIIVFDSFRTKVKDVSDSYMQRLTKFGLN